MAYKIKRFIFDKMEYVYQTPLHAYRETIKDAVDASFRTFRKNEHIKKLMNDTLIQLLKHQAAQILCDLGVQDKEAYNKINDDSFKLINTSRLQGAAHE
jgi:hypothetical protein